MAGEACTVREEGLEDQAAGSAAAATQRKSPAAADRWGNMGKSDVEGDGEARKLSGRVVPVAYGRYAACDAEQAAGVGVSNRKTATTS